MTKVQNASRKNDCSQVPVWEIAEVLEEYISRMRHAAEKTESNWSLEFWVSDIEGLDTGQIRKIMRRDTQLVGLRLVDLICHAMGSPELLHSFTFVPGFAVEKYSREMAYEEYMAMYDSEPPEEFLARRSAELRELRERVLSKASVA